MDPRTLHVYAYCGNDPVNNDPSGHKAKKLYKSRGKAIKVFAEKWNKKMIKNH